MKKTENNYKSKENSERIERFMKVTEWTLEDMLFHAPICKEDTQWLKELVPEEIALKAGLANGYTKEINKVFQEEINEVFQEELPSIDEEIANVSSTKTQK